MHEQDQELEPFARIGAAEAKQLIDSGTVRVIDVREPAEYERDHIAQAKLIPLGTLMQRSSELREDGVLFICEVGQRSAVACEMAASLGLEKLYNLEGGMTSWRQHGFPVEK
jgi:rhodanese-related sulfurtransferase